MITCHLLHLVFNETFPCFHVFQNRLHLGTQQRIQLFTSLSIQTPDMEEEKNQELNA